MTDAKNPRAMRPRSLFAYVIIAMGIVLGVSGGMEWWVGLKAERVSDLVRPEMTDSGLRQHREDFETARETMLGLNGDLLPAVANSLGVTSTNLRSEIDARYPDIARLLAEQDKILELGEQGVANLESHQEQFQRADAFPVSSLPGYSMAFMNLALAILVLAAGLAMLLRPEARTYRFALSVVLGASFILIVVPVAIGIPGKAADAEGVLDSLNPSQQVVDRTESSMATADAAFTELDQRLLPDFAIALGTTPEQFQEALAAQFPELATGLREMPEVLQRYEGRVAIRSGGAPHIRTLKNVPVGVLGWFGPVYGLALASVAIAGAISSRRSTALSAP